MFGIKNYKPAFYTPKNEWMKEHGETFKSLMGATLRGVWTMHAADGGEFWSDALSFC